MRILIAEDDRVSRILLERTLSRWGFEPVVCTDGKEALAMLQAPDAPDLALLDWMMPEIDGLEVCRRVRQAADNRARYIILVTAKSQREDIIAGLQAGADDYLTKPFDPKELHARLNVGIRLVNLQKDLAEKVDALEIAMGRIAQHQQNQKLEAIGRLASGVAHEINTPLQYIGDNVRFLQQSIEELAPAIHMLGSLPAALRAGADPETAASQIDSLLLKGDVSYVLNEMPRAVSQSLEGIGRVTKIVHAMRDFAHPSGENKSLIDLNRAIETTVTVARNEWKYVAEVVTDFDKDLPEVFCLPAAIQQVVLNLLENASHSIADAIGDSGQRGTIRISTAAKDGVIEIVMADSGKGIPEELREKVFEPFFTTKDVGKGTGQGLAIARSVIVEQHQGKIWFDSEVGKGATAFIHLPLDLKEDNTYEPAGEPTSAVCR